MKRGWLLSLMGLGMLFAGPGRMLAVGGSTPAQVTSLEDQVRERERAFAQTMADRDHAAFVTFLSEEAVFFDGESATRGSVAVAAAWAPLFQGPDAPFSWEPRIVQVLESGTLALSSGPVRDPAGNVAGTFNSIWRRDADGVWRVIFDKGCSGPPSSQGGEDCLSCW